jgi:putative hydrolase of the HAD superfamily
MSDVLGAALGAVPGAAPRAVLTDFGGVLTTSLFEAFHTYSASVSDDPELFGTLLGTDPAAGALLVEHECGRIDQAAFERGIAELLAPRGVELPAPGFVDSFQALLKPDEPMIAAMYALRAAGVPVAIVSNSLGDDAYRGFDLAALADVSVISGEVGVRKPSRAIYELACTRLRVEPAECVMIDDLEHNLRGSARLGIRGLHHTDSKRTIAQLAEWFGISV